MNSSSLSPVCKSYIFSLGALAPVSPGYACVYMNQERHPYILLYGHCDDNDQAADPIRIGWTILTKTVPLWGYKSIQHTENTGSFTIWTASASASAIRLCSSCQGIKATNKSCRLKLFKLF